MSHNPRELILSLGIKHKDIPQLRFISENQKVLKITKLGNGLVNYIYLVQSPGERNSVVIKYAEEQASSEKLKVHYCLGRQLLEYNCLKLINSVSPGSVPEPYVLDRELNIIAMEYLENMEVLGLALSKGQVDPGLAAKLGTIMGQFHFHTHRNVVNQQTWQKFQRTLTNPEILDVYLYYRFTVFEDFKEGSVVDPPDLSQFRRIMLDIQTRGIFKEIRKLFKQEDCLIHIDVHSLSVMVSQDRAALIDFEFGGLGHHSFSLGFLMAFYYMATRDTRNEKKSEKEVQIEETKSAMKHMVDAFFCAFGNKIDILGPKAIFISQMAAIFGHTIFVCPSYSIFPTFIQAEDVDRKIFIEQGYNLMSKYHTISTLEGIFSELFD